MEIKYIIEEKDHLTFQLHRASTLPSIKRKRLIEWLMTPISFLCLAFLFSYSEKTGLMYYFLVLGVIAIIGMPFYTKWRYKRHYLKHVRELYKNNFGKLCTFKFTDEYIEMIGEDGESKFKLSQITEVNEIADYYFLQLASGPTIIISKQKTAEREALASKIQEIVSQFKIKHIINLNWKWS